MNPKILLSAFLLVLGSVCNSEDVLKPVPFERQLSLPAGAVPLSIESSEATGECGMGLWFDEKLAVVLYPNERILFHVFPGAHEVRLSYEPLPDAPRDDKEKNKFKYCKKKEPEKLGFVRKINVSEQERYLLKVRSNKGYVYRLKLEKQ
ncbi:MAG: hypothetical protein K1W12_00340 [Turicimonas muris]|uniref:hypothetical protein n=1 Tax=Turicimonas muris TaxID=1796652 RepID=UPI0025B70375|nr:hypothetical protein [Turicimonas muris]